MIDPETSVLVRRFTVGLLLLVLLTLTWQVLSPFVVPVTWAGIFAYVTWPLYRRIHHWMRGYESIAALLMTLLLVAAFVVPVIWITGMLRNEVAGAYRLLLQEMGRTPIILPSFIAGIPWLGDQLQSFLNDLTANPDVLREQVRNWFEPRRKDMLRELGHDGALLGFAVLTVFFFYRDGRRFLIQLRTALEHFVGKRAQRYISAVASSTKAVVYGIVVTALAQGLLAGIGYWGAGVPAPVLLGIVTTLVALIPFGTPFVWVSVGLYWLLTGHTTEAVGLLLWGALVVSWVDNLIRPLVISNAIRIPFLLVMFGVIGGLAAFGMVGLFVGPVILAVLVSVWRQWVEEQAEMERLAEDARKRESVG